MRVVVLCFFFFQAEDGIRDYKVTGVQTCALPIFIQLIALGIAGSIGIWMFYVQHQFEDVYWEHGDKWDFKAAALEGSSFYKLRSEERRVGKECRSRWSPYH